MEALDLNLATHLIDQIRLQNAPLAEALAEVVKEYRFDRIQYLLTEITAR